jgi:hypothetical protein
MICSINDKSVVMPDPGGRLEAWLKDNWPELEDQLQCVAEAHSPRQEGFGGLYPPPWRKKPIIKLNALWWPAGASRVPFGVFLFDDATYQEVLETGPSLYVLRIGEDSEGEAVFASEVLLIPPIPLVGTPDETRLWLLPVTMGGPIQSRQTTLSSSWAGSAVEPNDAYQSMDNAIASSGSFAPECLADIQSWSHHRRAARKWRNDAGVYFAVQNRFLAASEAVELFDDQVEALAAYVMAGRIEQDAPVPPSITFSHPWYYQRHAKRADGRLGMYHATKWGNSPQLPELVEGDHLVKSFNYAKAVYAPDRDLTGFYGSSLVTCSIPYVAKGLASGVPTAEGDFNADATVSHTTELEDFHEAWLADFLIWSSRTCNMVYADIQPYQLTGFEDYVVFETWPRPLTRVVSMTMQAMFGPNVAGYNDRSSPLNLGDTVYLYRGGESGAWYLQRTGDPSDYTYSQPLAIDPYAPDAESPDGYTSPFDPLHLVAYGDTTEAEGIAIWNGYRFVLIQTKMVELSVVTTASVSTGSDSEPCKYLNNARSKIRVNSFVEEDPTHEGRVMTCVYTGGGGGGSSGEGYDPGSGFTYQGAGVWTLNEGETATEYQPPEWSPPEEPDDWSFFTDGSTFGYWFSASTGFYLYVYW